MGALKEEVNWGIIGCGDVAEKKSGPAFQKVENSNLLAVMRRDKTKAKDFAERHKVPEWFDDASQLLAHCEINAIYVATPPSSHLEYALQALDAGKNVYLEKPMVITKEEADVLSEAVRKSNKKLVVAHYRRYLPLYLKVKELLNIKVIGDIKYVDLKYLKVDEPKEWRLNPSISGGGLFHDIAPHQIDLMYYFFGDYADAKGFAFNQEQKHSVSDIVNGVISFNNGIQFRGIWNFDTPAFLEQDNCTIYGTKGTISFPLFGEEVSVRCNKKESTYRFTNPTHIQQPFIQETVNYFLNKRENPCSVEEGAIVTKIMSAFI